MQILRRAGARLGWLAAISTLAIATAGLAQTLVPPAGTGARPGNDIGTGQSLPLSNKASNISPTDTGSSIAPRLPPPPIDEGAPPVAFLQAAAQALAAGRTGEAQEAMERAETRALDRSVRPSLARKPDEKPLVAQIAAARAALSEGDRLQALHLLQQAIRNPDATGSVK